MLHRTTYRHLHVLQTILLLILVMAFMRGSGQQEPVLSPGEARMLSALKDRFVPVPSVDRIWTGAFQSAAQKSAALKASIDSVQRSGLSEEDVLVRVGALRQEQKTIKKDRNAFVAGFLSPLQQMALDSILNPPAPSIQHFGFHDRLKCLVCKKPNEGAMFPSGMKSPDQLMTPKQ